MPASEAQIKANRENSRQSCGPRSTERTRLNATKHGLAAHLPEVGADRSPEFEARRARWAAEHRPEGEAANWALDRVVDASLRIEKCERGIDEHINATRERARLAWDQDRRAEAAVVAAKLGKDPVLISRQLQTSMAGVELMIEAWLGLAAAIQQDGGDWSESQASTALDLLGVAVDLRSGPTLLDPMDGTDPLAYRKTLTYQELERLEAIRDQAMAPLDDLERRQAMKGDVALLSKPAQLLLRYERDAWRRYRESMKELASQPKAEIAPPPEIVQPSPIPPAPPIQPKPPEPEPSTDAAAVPVASRPSQPIPVPASTPATERSQFHHLLHAQELARLAR